MRFFTMQAKRNKRYAPWGMADTPITLRLKKTEIVAVDVMASSVGISRSACIRLAMLAGISHVPLAVQSAAQNSEQEQL